jgi:DNA-binding XRE family transcriptional regulator
MMDLSGAIVKCLDYGIDHLRVFLIPMSSLPPLDPALATVLRRVRKERGETQEDVAFGAGVTTLTIRRAEQATVIPSWGTVRAIAQALDLSLVELAKAVEREER